MNVLYVDPDGRVRSGRLGPGEAADSDDPPVLVSRTGEVRHPQDVLALLAPCTPTEDQRALLSRATRAGYSVESA